MLSRWNETSNLQQSRSEISSLLHNTTTAICGVLSSFLRANRKRRLSKNAEEMLSLHPATGFKGTQRFLLQPEAKSHGISNTSRTLQAPLICWPKARFLLRILNQDGDAVHPTQGTVSEATNKNAVFWTFPVAGTNTSELQRSAADEAPGIPGSQRSLCVILTQL